LRENQWHAAENAGLWLGRCHDDAQVRYLGGKCADINALFVALARAVRIPARDACGVRVADSRLGFKSLGRSGDISKAQHCRAEFYAQKYGWIPVDPAYVRSCWSKPPAGCQ
jgi:transglutaminase-like putative cysteine protease